MGILGIQLEQGLAEHRGAVGSTGPVIIERSSLGSHHLGRGPDGLGRPRLSNQGGLGVACTYGGRRDTTQADDRAADHAIGHVEREAHGNAGDVVETALGDLVEARQRGERPADPDFLDQLARCADARPITGVVVGQRHKAFAVDRRKDQLSLKGEKRGRRITDR